jgi:hypothetical protein
MKQEEKEMKKKICLAMLVGLMCVAMSGCGNRQLFDTTYSFEKAILSLPNGEVIEGTVTSWKDYENSDQIQVEINGKQYLVHSSNIVLISE